VEEVVEDDCGGGGGVWLDGLVVVVVVVACPVRMIGAGCGGGCWIEISFFCLIFFIFYKDLIFRGLK
jgi:hypothetical protein